MHRFRYVTVGVLLSLGLAVGIWTSHADDKNMTFAPPEKDASKFEPKYVAVELDRALDQHSTWLKEPRLQTIGGESFLVGRDFSITEDGKDKVGVTIWVSLHHVEQIYTYESIEEIK